MPLPGSYGLSPFGSGPYGSFFAPFGVTAATALNSNLVRVSFSEPVDFSDPAVLSPSNYTITPPLTVVGVVIDTLQSVRLMTATQSFVAYEVVVASARALSGTLLSPVLNTVFFTGWPINPSYFAVGTFFTRVRLIFSEPMLADLALSDPTSYQVTNLQGVALPIISAVPEQSSHPRSVLLTLGIPMRTTEWYQAVIVGPIQTETLLTPQPAQSVFQFIAADRTFSVPLEDFTGEVQGGLFGTPAGLVFFSPALQTAIPNSVIQVDQVDVCTTAYDEYHPPQPPDPSPFYTWSALGPSTVLGQAGIALWAPFPRLFEARFELTFTGPSMVEPMPVPLDGGCSITMREPWDKSYVALLNNPAWKIFDNTGMVVPPLFICANNLAPIPPGPEAITILHVAFPGGSSMQANAHRLVGPDAAVVGGASVTADLTVA